MGVTKYQHGPQDLSCNPPDGVGCVK